MLAALLLLGFVAQTYINGAFGTTWHLARSFGFRRLIECTPIFVLGLAPLVAWLRARAGRALPLILAALLIAWNVADLHGDVQRDRNSINKEFALDEKGQPVKGRGDQPNQHDILTGSDSHGRAVLGSAANTTCNNWTSNSSGSAVVGHHDRSGGGNSSWNAAHPSRGCGQQDLVATGGAGLFYCFAGN